MIIDISTLIPGFTFLLYIALTLFGILNSKAERMGRSFQLYMGAMTIWSLGSFMMHANTGFLTPLIWNRLMIVGMFAMPIVFFYAMVNLSAARSHQRPRILAIGYMIYGFLLVLNFLGLIVSEAGFRNTVFYYELGSFAPVAYILLYAYLILAIFVISRDIRRAHDALNRKKLTPLLIGAVILLIGQLANLDESIGRYPIDLAAAALNGLLIFYSIYKYKLVHYSQTVLKTLVYFILIVSLAALFTAIQWIYSPTMREIDFRHRFLLSMVLSFIAAIVFQPLRQGALWTIGQIYSGKRLSYYQSLKAFSESLTSLVELETLVATIINKIHATFDPSWVAMFVLDYGDRNFRLLSQCGISISDSETSSVIIPGDDKWWEPYRETRFASNQRDNEQLPLHLAGTQHTINPRLVIPLRFRDRINGYIVVGRPQNKEYYHQLALETLDLFAGQCSIALENAITFERLRSQQRRLQEMNSELTISRNKLEAFFDGITAPISLQDINYNVVLVNKAAARFFHIPPNELAGKKCYQVYFQQDKPCRGCLAQDCLHTQFPFSIEMDHQATHTSFMTHFYPIVVPDGSPKLFLEFFHDVTEQKRLMEELVQSAKLAGIGTLASGIAHEINNPLAAISATAEVILEDTGISAGIQEYAEDILKCAHNAASIIKDLNTYSRKNTTEQSEVDIVDTIQAALKMAMRGLDTDRIVIQTSFEDMPVIIGNANEMQQVFLNLIVNSIQAMHGSGSLSISVATREGNATIEVSDTGEGISPELVDHVFNPFFTTKEPGEGTGLGLSIVHQILHRHGGRINAVSLPGQSTTMRVQLPLANADPPTIRFVQARTENDLEDVFFLQRKILIGEMGYREETILRPKDTRSFHIVAYKGLQPVGTVTCVLDSDVGPLPIAEHLEPDIDVFSSETMAEVDRLAVVTEERGGLVPLGLMMLAYLYARSRDAQLVFLDVFTEDTQQLKLYLKVGFEEVCHYHDPSEVTVMVLKHRLSYETDSKRLNNFLRPLMSRLISRIDFEPGIKSAILRQAEPILTGCSNAGSTVSN